ncbi:MAG: putative 4-hydroxybenzoate polyprenyltransferase [Gemmataceae bacterium]|nr:putative 4-hydroxybenzoate polyprenyltransferase [Gemmataceae bacterium]
MFRAVVDFLGMVRFSHTIFALPFALASAVLAWQAVPFQWPHLVGILLGMVLARSAAMGFNRLADRHLDAANPRTANRHLVTGRLTVRAVTLFTLACSLGFIASTAIFLLNDPPNPWPLRLAVPVLLFILAYSYTKRFTFLAHFWLGASLMLAPLASWIATRGLTELQTPLLLGCAVLFWVAGFDILYATQDADFDRKARLHSVPARFGIRASLKIALVCHLMMLLSLLALYFVSPMLGNVYLLGIFGIALLLAYEHWLVRPNDLTRVNQAFFQVNGIISIGLLVIVLVQIWVRA